MNDDVAEVTDTLHAVGRAIEQLIVRGVRSTGPDDVRELAHIAEQLERAGAAYAASTLGELVTRVREQDAGAPRALLRAQTALRVFERVLSLEVAAAALAADSPGQAPPAAPAVTEGNADPALAPVLEELAALVEGLVASGMTTASAATRQKLDASFKEASRLKLLRLATSLRYVNDECGRFLAESEHFSARRLAFFLNRTWLISRGLLDALARGDRAALARLLLQSAPQPVKALSLAVVGVQKRALLDGGASFDFRMRVLADAGPIARGTRLAWSCVFGAKKNVPAEAFLHLPQPQKFSPKILLDPVTIAVTDAAVALDGAGGGRLMLGPKSTVSAGKKLTGWVGLVSWDRASAVRRIQAHRPSPLDLEVELQEDIVVADWTLAAAATNAQRPDQRVYPLTADGLVLDAIVSTGPDGNELGEALEALRKPKAKRPPLYGLLHYEMGRLVFQPLAVLKDTGPDHLMISTDKIDLASLMKTMDFTS